MRIVPAARPVCSATSLIARFLTSFEHATAAARRPDRSGAMMPPPTMTQRPIARATIADPEQHTVMDRGGAARSVQAANVDMPLTELEGLWSPANLERLARTYWKYLSRVTLGLIRVDYTESERSVVFLGRPLVLLRFSAPEYELAADRGVVRWAIQDGLLVARPHEGFLEIDVKRVDAGRPGIGRVHIEVEVANFYPAIATWVARWFYQQTQSRIHVLVTHGFLRSLAKRELEESAVGRFAPPALRRPFPPREPVPWVLIGAVAAAVFLLLRR